MKRCSHVFDVPIILSICSYVFAITVFGISVWTPGSVGKSAGLNKQIKQRNEYKLAQNSINDLFIEVPISA